MSKLLNRGNVFAVVREGHYGCETVVCGVFSEMDEADDYRGMCEQQWKEKVGSSLDRVVFTVQLTTYYGK